MKQFFGVYYSRLSYFGSTLVRTQQAAQDFAQEALVSFWQRREEFRQASLKQAEAFLFAVVRNKSYNFLKHEKMKAGKAGDLLSGPAFEAEAETRFMQEDIFNRIYKEIQQLPPAQAQLLSMIYVEGMETDEIAKRLAITPNNVRNQKARALEKVRELLSKKGLLNLFLLFF
jgi:RNA polymerase sigma-70 factor (ECF subfamily)